jgi:hypothetical protein
MRTIPRTVCFVASILLLLSISSFCQNQISQERVTIKSIIGKTKVYWCPIKNKRDLNTSHEHYNKFVDINNLTNFKAQR